MNLPEAGDGLRNMPECVRMMVPKCLIVRGRPHADAVQYDQKYPFNVHIQNLVFFFCYLLIITIYQIPKSFEKQI